MAGNNLIGALRVSLGLDSAEFDAGLKRAQSGLAGFGKTVGIGLAAVTAAAASATVGLGVAVKGAIDHADALSKASQKAGVTTESLSRLAYAASYSDVSLDGLTGGLGKLSKSLADAAGNSKGTAATAFRALGVSVTDANGKLRSSDDVLKDVADRFSRLEDGSTKTALAMQLLGKSGAEMIPFLNGGANEIKRLSDEADRLGITLSTKTGRQAEHFNDTIAIVGNVLQGVVNKIMEAALPALDQFAQVLASPKFAEAAQSLATGVVAALSMITQVLTGLINGFVDLGNKIAAAFSYASGDPMQRSTAQLKKDIADYQKMLISGNVSDRYGTTMRLSNAQAELALRGTVAGMGRAIAGGATSLAAPKAPSSSDVPNLNLPANIFKTGGDADKAKKAYDRVIASANDRIAQSKVEADALGKSALEADKLRFAQGLLADATRDGNKLLPEQIFQLNGLADTMAVAADKTRQLTDIYDTGHQVFSSFFSDLKSDLMGGTSLWGSFADAASKALGTIADKALGMAADGIWDMIFGALKGSLTGGNFIGGSIGAPALQLGFQKGIPGFANGGSGLIPGSGPTDSRLFLARVTPGEAFAFGDDAVRGMGGGGHSFNFSIDARGAQQGVAQQLDQWGKLVLPGLIRKALNDPYAVG